MSKPLRLDDEIAELAAMASDGLSIYEIEEITGIPAELVERAVNDFENRNSDLEVFDDLERELDR
jgi:hypothetical protein